jgi:hypothetical protein
MSINLNDHLSMFIVAGFYYWFMGDELGAKTCWETGEYVLRQTFMTIPNPKEQKHDWA